MSSKGKGKKGAEKWDVEDVIQAVVIADSFNFRFLPITIENPRALLPLVNRPLIDYTVEFLAVAGVQEIFVFCCAHAEKIKTHLEASRWMKPTSPVKLRIIISEDCPSVGDALRDIDSQSLIRSDFVLVSGDLVSNMELKEVIERHKEMRKKDKLLVMTCVYKKANPNHRTRSSEDDILIVTNATDGRLLFCEKPSGKKKMAIPVSIFDENPDVELHYDVLDCHVSICSPNVAQLFSDNFDYQTRHHFIRGVLVSEEITGDRIYSHFISDQYAARVSNLRTYDAISKDVIHRWVYPLVPDNMIEETYSYGRHNKYLNTNVVLSLGCVLHEDVVIGNGTFVGTNSQISHSSIGHKCRIGDNVTIEGSYVWDDVIIESNCTVRQAIICNGATVKANVSLEPGSILSYNVVVGPDFTVRAGSRLTTKRQVDRSLFDSDWGSEEEEEGEAERGGGRGKPVKQQSSREEEAVAEEVGREGRGFLWRPPSQDEEDDSDHIVIEKWPFEEKEDLGGDSSASSSRSTTPESHMHMEAGDTDAIMFYNEILDSVRSGIAELVPNDNTILMINASKHAYNIPIQDVPQAVVKAILEGPQNSKTGQPSELLMYVKNAVSHFESLLTHYIKGHEAQVTVLNTFAECAALHPNVLAIFAKVVLQFYNADIVEEPAIVEWHSKLLEASDLFPKKQELLTCIRPVIEWLKSAEEESSEDEED